MPLFWCDAEYLIVMALVGAMLVWVLRILLRRRQKARRKTGPKTAPIGLKVGMACWLIFASLYTLEFVFGAFVEFTDAFSATNVSDRWFARYIEPFRNEYGFRDSRPLPDEPQPNTTDVFFIGDSFTIGQGIEQPEDLFVSQTETLLNQKQVQLQKPIRTFNLGDFGWEVSWIESVTKGVLKKSNPDVFVYVYMLNDVEGYDPRTQESIKKIQTTEPKSWLWTRTYFYNWLYFRWQQSQASRTVDYFPHLADSYREPPWTGVTLSLQNIKTACDENGTEFRMVFFPFLHNLGDNYEFKHAHKQLADFCDQNGIRYLDLEPILTPRTGEGLMVNRFDNHPNEHCHAIVAEAIANQLLDDLPRAE